MFSGCPLRGLIQSQRIIRLVCSGMERTKASYSGSLIPFRLIVNSLFLTFPFNPQESSAPRRYIQHGNEVGIPSSVRRRYIQHGQEVKIPSTMMTDTVAAKFRKPSGISCGLLTSQPTRTSPGYGTRLRLTDLVLL